MSRDINMFARPDLALRFIEGCAKRGHTVVITCVDRTAAEQAALWCQGRFPLNITNKTRALAGLQPIGEKENSRKITWVKTSRHQRNEKDPASRSQAIDFAIVRAGKVSWDIKADVDGDQIPDYLECAQVGESLGLVSGARWKTPDYPHLELPK